MFSSYQKLIKTIKIKKMKEWNIFEWGFLTNLESVKQRILANNFGSESRIKIKYDKLTNVPFEWLLFDLLSDLLLFKVFWFVLFSRKFELIFVVKCRALPWKFVS